jgi:copper(I)-binding protein
MRLILSAALALLASASLAAAAERVGGLVVADPWIRATVVAGRPGAAYFTLRNEGAAPDRLVDVSAPVAGHAMLHETTLSADGVARMEHVIALEVPAGGAVTLAPGGLHVMLMDLKEALTPGGEIQLTLTFEKAGTVTIGAPVLGPAATGPAP